MSTEATSRSAGDLSLELLLKIMARLRELQVNLGSYTRTDDFVNLIPADLEFPTNNRPVVMHNLYIDHHLEFLQERGYVSLGTPTLDQVRIVEFTAEGRMFVQPELAEFGRAPILPDVVRALEDKIQILSYPEEEKAAMLYRLREAIEKRAPDLIAAVLIGLSERAMRGSA